MKKQFKKNKRKKEEMSAKLDKQYILKVKAEKDNGL